MPRPSVLARLFSHRLGALERHLAAALDGDVHGVHQARVASRRLREVVPIAGRPGHDKLRRKTARRIRRLTRALGPVRELDVTLDVLDKWPAENQPEVAAALEVVRAHVRLARDARRADLVEAFPPAGAGDTIQRLREPGERLIAAGQRATAGAEDVTPWRVTLAQRIASRAAALEQAIDDAGVLYEPERLHGVRIATKKTRYVLEVTGETRLAGTARLVTALKGGQEMLGDLHDLQIAAGFVAEARKGATSAGLDTLAEKLGDRCRELHAEYVGHRERLALVAETARDAVRPKLLRPRRRSRAVVHAPATDAFQVA